MATNELDTALLRHYIHDFFGYGSLRAPYWFVGLEEGGEAATIAARVEQWKQLGAGTLVDLYEMHKRLPGGLQWFSEHPRIQPTWSKLIRIVLLAENRDADTESLRTYQRDRLGRADGETALLELMPLPSRNLGEWQHCDQLPELRTRKIYASTFREERATRLLELIDSHQPRNAIFYGMRRHWPEWLGGVTTTTHEHFDVAHRGASQLIFMRHPTARGVTNAELGAIATATRGS